MVVRVAAQMLFVDALPSLSVSLIPPVRPALFSHRLEFFPSQRRLFSTYPARDAALILRLGGGGGVWSKRLASPSFRSCQHLRGTVHREFFASSMAAAPNGPPPNYRANVGICLVNEKNEVFVASRLDAPGAWQMPQGGVEEGEDPQAAAFRELREETGVTSAAFLGEVPEWLTYDFPPDVKAKITVLWGREWTGQAQKWFLFRFTGNESEINLAGDGMEAPEFSEWKWVPVEDVITNAVIFKKPVYERAFSFLGPLMKS